MSLVTRIREWLAILGLLSPVTRLFLAVYALSIPTSWVLRYPPGAHFVELESVEPLSNLALNVVFPDGNRERAIAAAIREPGWPILDWSKSEVLTPELEGLYAGSIDLKWAPTQALDSKAGLQILAWEHGDAVYHRFTNGPKATETRSAPRDALWLKPSGGIVGATPVYAEAETKFGAKPHYASLWHVGSLVVARPEAERYVQEDERYVKKQVAADRHFLTFDAESGRAIAKVETDMRIDGVYPSPRFTGLLYSSGPYLEYLQCNGEHCAPKRVELDTGYIDIVAACYDPKYERIAVCAGNSLFLYEGAPGDEDIVYLGHGTLDDPCDKVWIADSSTLLLSLVEGFYAVARFRWIR